MGYNPLMASDGISANGDLFPVRAVADGEARDRASATGRQVDDAARILRRRDTGGHRRRDVGVCRILDLFTRTNPLKTARLKFAHNKVVDGFWLSVESGDVFVTQLSTLISQLDIVRDRHDRDVLVFPNADPIRGRFQLSIGRIHTGHVRAGELHATRMQDETATVHEERVAVERITRHLATFGAMTALDGRTVQIGEAHAERAAAEQIGRIDQTIGGASAGRATIVHNHAPALERLDLSFTLAVRDEVNQIELAKRGLDRRVHRHGHEPVATIAKPLSRVHEGRAVQLGRSSLRGDGFGMNRQQVACHARRTENSGEGVDEHVLVLAIPVFSEEVRQRQCRIVTGHLRRQMIPRPRIAVVLDAGDVLVSDQLRRHERCRIRERLPATSQVIPVRHVDLRAAQRGALVIVRRPHDNAGLKQVGFLRRALENVTSELRWHDDVCKLCLCHKLSFML